MREGATRLAFAAAVFAMAVAGRSLADPAPMPPPRPVELGGHPLEMPPPESPPVPDTPPPATPPAPPAAGAAAGCLGELRRAGALAEEVGQPAVPDPACAIDTPVRMTAVANLAGRPGAIALPDGPVISCRLALVFASWTGRVAAPILAARRQSELKAVRTGPGFACRPRNRQAGAKLSAHGLGLAIDVAGFDFADGSTLAVGPAGTGDRDPAFAAVRVSACGWFTTVLGPGSDVFHANHLHLDVQQHGSSDRYRICQ